MSSYPTQPPPGYQPDRVVYVEKPSSALGAVALVLGVLGLMLAIGPALFAVFGLACGLGGLVLGIVATAKDSGRGMGIAGIVLGGVAFLVAIVAMSAMSSALDDVQRDLDEITSEAS